MTLPKMNADVGHVQEPCHVVTDVSSLPEPMVKFMETLDLHDDFEVIEVHDAHDFVDVFLINDPGSGDRHMVVVKRGSQQIKHESMLAELPARRCVDALALFVEAAGAGMMHFDSWEEHQEYSRLTEEEFDALYSGNTEVLDLILSEFVPF